MDQFLISRIYWVNDMLDSFPIRQELTFPTPFMNAAGTLGYIPRADWLFDQPAGVFVTPPISLEARAPASNRACIPFPGGVLLHNGLPNPGLKSAIRLYAKYWQRSPIPVWVHLIPQHPNELPGMIRKLEEVPGIGAIEVGLPPECGLAAAIEYVKAAAGELPLVIHVSLTEMTLELITPLAQLGVSAVSLGAPRGCLPSGNGQRLVSGRLFGPSVLPLALAAVRSLSRSEMPVIASGGVYDLATAHLLLSAGAKAVQLDTILWRGTGN
jgi:dihydroorotate dehydrogenase (NAD+) catalytic subunit